MKKKKKLSSWKETEENNRMGKSRDLFQKSIDTKGTFHAKMGTTKERNGTDLTEAEDVNKRWQEYTGLYKNDLQVLDYHNGVIINLEPASWNVKSSGPYLGSSTMNKASEGDRIRVQLFQILKDDAMKVLHSIGQQIWKM